MKKYLTSRRYFFISLKLGDMNKIENKILIEIVSKKWEMTKIENKNNYILYK